MGEGACFTCGSVGIPRLHSVKGLCKYNTFAKKWTWWVMDVYSASISIFYGVWVGRVNPIKFWGLCDLLYIYI